MSSLPGAQAHPYYPLGLPPGSVRAVLTITIAGLFWLLLMLPKEQAPPVPLYLYALLPLVLLFFAAHGQSIRPAGVNVSSPLYLPRGLIRLVVVLGFVGAAVWLVWHDPEHLRNRLTPTENQLPELPWVMLALSGGFMFGHLLRMNPWRNSPVFQNLVAWVALIAMFGLLIEVIIELVIKPNLRQEWNPFVWECLLTALVSFYFGLRS